MGNNTEPIGVHLYQSGSQRYCFCQYKIHTPPQEKKNDSTILLEVDAVSSEEVPEISMVYPLAFQHNGSQKYDSLR